MGNGTHPVVELGKQDCDSASQLKLPAEFFMKATHLMSCDRKLEGNGSYPSVAGLFIVPFSCQGLNLKFTSDLSDLSQQSSDKSQ